MVEKNSGGKIGMENTEGLNSKIQSRDSDDPGTISGEAKSANAGTHLKQTGHVSARALNGTADDSGVIANGDPITSVKAGDIWRDDPNFMPSVQIAKC